MEPTYVPLLPAGPPVPSEAAPAVKSAVANEFSHKTAMGAVIVVISIIVVIIISVVTWYFLQDPWEQPQTEDSTLRKDYYKEQINFYAWDRLHQSPYLLLHLYAPIGHISHSPSLIANWQSVLAPIFEFRFHMSTEMIGLTRLRKKGIQLSALDVVEKWKRDRFFPIPEKRDVNHLETKGIPKSVEYEFMADSLEKFPYALFTFIWQEPETKKEIKLATHVHILTCTTSHLPSGNEIVFYVNPLLENTDTYNFFKSLMQTTPVPQSSSPLSEKEPLPESYPQFFGLEAMIYNPQWSIQTHSNTPSMLFHG